MPKYDVNEAAFKFAKDMIERRRYVLRSDWGERQPHAADQNRFLKTHDWAAYGEWHLGLTKGANEETKARYAFGFGDFRRVHRTGIIAVHFRAAEWRHKDVELAAHELLQILDKRAGIA